MEPTGNKRSLTLGDVQETMLIPLYARAVETGKKRPILRDQAAVDMIAAIDYDFSRFGPWQRVMSTYHALRTAIFDEYVRQFLAASSAGTVVEIGAGLSTRYERLDNGQARWIDIDLPDSAEVRRSFLADGPRRRTIAHSVLDESWIPLVAASPGPYLFVSEGVLVYLTQPDVNLALSMVTRNFPGAAVAFDTYGTWIVKDRGRRGPIAATRASLTWACDDPHEIERWGLGLRLVQSRTLVQPQPAVARRITPAIRALLRLIPTVAPRWANSTRMNLFQHEVGNRAPRD